MIRLEEQRASLRPTVSITFLLVISYVAVTCPVAAISSFKADLASCGEHFASPIHDVIGDSKNVVLLDRGATVLIVAGTGNGSPVQRLCRGMQYEIKVTFNSPRTARLTASQGSFSAAPAGCPNLFSQTTPVTALTVNFTAPCSAEDGLVLFRLTSVDPSTPLELLGTTTSLRLDLDPYSSCTSDMCTEISTPYKRVLTAQGPVVTQAAVDDWLANQQLAFFPTRVTYEDASARCFALGGRLVTVAEWIEAVDDMRTSGGHLGDILVSVLVGLYDFGDNNGRPWNAWGANSLGRRTCAAVQIDSSTVTVASSAPSVNCTQLLYYMCVGRYFVLDPPPPPPPSPPPPPPRPPVVPNPGIRDLWDERVWTFFDYRVPLRDADARCRDIGGGAHLASLAEWQDLSTALAASRVNRLYNGMSAAMFYFGDYSGRPWNFWTSGGPGAGQGGCGALRVDPLAIMVTQTSLAASCQQNLMFLCVQLAVGLPNLPAEPPLPPSSPKPKFLSPPLLPPLKSSQPPLRPSPKPPLRQPMMKSPPPPPPSPKPLQPPSPKPPRPPSPKPPRPPQPSPPPSPRPPCLPKPPQPSPYPPNYPPLPPSPRPPGHPQLPPPSPPPPQKPSPPLIPSLKSPEILLPPPPHMPPSQLSVPPSPAPIATRPSPSSPPHPAPKLLKPSTRPSRRPHPPTPPRPPAPPRPPLPPRPPQRFPPSSPLPPGPPSPQPSSLRLPISPLHPTPPLPPPSQCNPSAQGFDCSLPLGEGLTIHWSPASLMTSVVMRSSPPPSAPPAGSPCVQDYSDPGVRATFHVLLEAPGASQISLAFLPLMRGGVSPGISAFVTRDGAIRVATYEAFLIPAPGRDVQLYNASTEDPYGTGPWPIGPPGPSNWTVDKAAVRTRSSSGSTRVALCFSAAAPPLGARSVDAFMVTLVPEQQESSGGVNAAARRMWAVDGDILHAQDSDHGSLHDYHHPHSYHHHHHHHQQEELKQKRQQHRRSLFLSHQRQQQTEKEAGRILDIGSEIPTGWNAGASVDRRLASYSYHYPPPLDHVHPPPPTPPPLPSPDTPVASKIGNTVAVRLGNACGGRQVVLLRRAGTLSECESACSRMGFMLGASSQPGYDLTGGDYEAAWGAVLQQLPPGAGQNMESGNVVGGWVGPAQPDEDMHHHHPPGSSSTSLPFCTSTILHYQYGWLRSAPCSTLGWCLCWSPEEAHRE